MREAKMNEVDAKDPFELDVRLVIDVSAVEAGPCDTNDGCAPTCASSCASR
jgi:FxLD family lantipeptide